MAPAPAIQVPFVNANFAVVSMSSWLNGIFQILAILSNYLLATRHKGSLPRGAGRMTFWARWKGLFKNPLFLLGIGSWFAATMHWLLMVIRGYKAFIFFKDGAAPAEFYAEFAEVTQVTKTGVLIAALAFGDLAIIYRLWIIWGKSWQVVVFPLMTWLGLIICGIGITYQFSIFTPTENVFVSAAGRFITSNAAFTLATNIYCTATIVFRLVRSSAGSAQPYGSHNMLSTVAIVIESAAVYTVWMIFFISTYLDGTNLQFPAIDLAPQMSGISFMLINVRVGLGWAAKGLSTSRRGLMSTTGGVGTSAGGVLSAMRFDATNTARGGAPMAFGSNANFGGASAVDTFLSIKDDKDMDIEMRAGGGQGRRMEVNITHEVDTEPSPYDDTKPETAPWNQ